MLSKTLNTAPTHCGPISNKFCLKNKHPLPNYIVSGDTVFTTNNDIAKEFNQFFVSIASKLLENVPCADLSTFPAHVPEDTMFELPPVAEEYVRKQID